MRGSLPVLYNLSIWMLISQRLSNLCSRIIIGLHPTDSCYYGGGTRGTARHISYDTFLHIISLICFLVSFSIMSDANS